MPVRVLVRSGASLVLALVLLSGLWGGGPPAAEAAEPTQRWYTITTPHFEVHYYKSVRHDEAAMAQKVARIAERCHRVLVPIFRHEPSSRTHIVVTDDTDGANGSAQSIPYNIIRVFLTGPSSRSYLHDYEDWLLGLIMHEYTHILHMDTIHGLPRVVNAVMGRIWAPNQMQPRWFIEGLAVHQETKQTSGGRLRTSLFDMTLRAHVLSGKLLRLDQISSNTRLYPRGHVPYLYGAYFVRYIADRYGEAALTKISHGYGGTPVPYALNKVAKKVLGKTYEQLYVEFCAYLKQRYGLQKAVVLGRGRTRRQRLTRHAWAVGSPRFSPDGKQLVYLASDGRSQAAIRIADVAQLGGAKPRLTLKRRWQMPHLGGHTVAFSPDGRHLVYGRGVNWRTFHAYHDLYVRRRSGGVSRRLTDGLRARDPDVSRDGGTVAFVMNELGDNHLALIPFSGGKHRVLRKGAGGEQFFRPRFSPDGKRLVVSYWRPGGRRDIALVDVASGALKLLTDDRAMDLDPVFSKDGKRVFFSSDRTGIFNIYCLELSSGRLWQLTNVLGAALGPTLSADERRLIYVGFGPYGFDLHGTVLERRHWRPALPYIDTRPPARHARALAATGQGRGGKAAATTGARQRPMRGGAARPAAARPYPVARYNPLWTAYPRSWSASLASDQFGNLVSLTVEGADAINRHRYRVTTNMSTDQGHLSYLAGYSYNRFWPSLNISTTRAVRPRGGVVIDGRQRTYVEQIYGVNGSVGLPVLRMPQHSVGINIGYALNTYDDADDTKAVVLPGQIPPRLPNEGRTAGLTASITYTNILRFNESISSESGRQLTVGLRVADAIFGSESRSTQVTWAWTEFLDLPWLDDHVLALRYAGGVATGGRRAFAVGGFPSQNVIDAVINQLPMGGSYLRGYPPRKFSGDQFHLLNVEYRAPLLELERGMSSLPLYLNFVHIAAFVDVGHAFFGDLEPSDLKVGVGGELLLEFVVGYFVPLTLRLGYARGLRDEGGNELFMLIGRRF